MTGSPADPAAEVAKWEALGDVDITKKVKNLKKKLRQIEELEAKAKTGEPLNQGEPLSAPPVLDGGDVGEGPLWPSVVRAHICGEC